MPIRQYFLWVGSILLTALLATNWLFPVPAVQPHPEIPPNERTNLRIRSDQKWPARIVFDTTHPRPSLAPETHPEPDIVPRQELAESERRGPLDSFAAMEPTDAARAATNDKASAIQAKPRPARLRMTGTIKAD
jgi:hypothetical protein